VNGAERSLPVAVLPAARDMAGPEALPRDNGSLVFDAPWQGRALGTALALVERLGVPWDAFRQHLIRAIADQPDRPYYDSWVAALEAFAVEHGVVEPTELHVRP
jgi:nitrile hydratase accessory protein